MSSNTKIRRGQPGKARPNVGARRKIPVKRKSLFVSAAELLPFPMETIQKAIGYGAVVAGIGVAIGAVTFLGLPQMAGVAMAEMAGRAGFEVKRIEVAGIDRMERMTVYAIATDQQSMAMPLVDLEDVRRRLMDQPWIAEARVSRRLPDTLLIDIVERKPAAVWQNQQQLSLIDGSGVVLEPVALEAMPKLPLVIGPNANLQTTALRTLLGGAPALSPMVAGATWVGNRRWDLRFQSGETLALPEGEREARHSLIKFAKLDGTERLLGRGFVRFDMRIPGKFVVRVPPRDAGKDEAKLAEGTKAPAAVIKAEKPKAATTKTDNAKADTKGKKNGTGEG